MKKICIRHHGDRGMFFGQNGWSSNPDDAKEFTSALEAITFIIQKQISHAELVVDGVESYLRKLAVAV